MRFSFVFGAASWLILPAFTEAAACASPPRKFDLTLTWEKRAPNGGVAREIILTNGQFPGPLLDINEGDNVEILVHNKLPFNTTVHWHGIEMRNTPWSDGVPGQYLGF